MRESVVSSNLPLETERITDRRVVYALNMCTVSVSQIIDYNDMNILDQEYDAILNNLNLEEMPKDDALREVLEDLLDVITHFRVSELEKQFIEREYQQKMKNAIWSAVPNFGMILAGGNPLTMAVSLANQVGIGYMNYRRNREEYSMARDRQTLQLKKTAIEQFNYIRKKLFDCAWRLSDTHGFPDNYRLTEKQIAQYNAILQDKDLRRKYDRLDTVKDQFEAYPPFWYFIGNAANSIANDNSLCLSENSRQKFRESALCYFAKFEEIEQNSLLREDVLSASCALEHIDLLLQTGCTDEGKIQGLLSKAVKMAGKSYDILQLCAISYLKLGKVDSAVKILKELVNESYNTTVNAQMLSAIYVRSFDKYQADYELLATRVNQKHLFPAPYSGKDIKVLESEFESKRKNIAKAEASATLKNFVQKYEVEWNSILSTFEPGKTYQEDFFYENDTAKMKRKNEAEQVFGVPNRREEYQNLLVSCNFEPNIRRILNEIVRKLTDLNIFSCGNMKLAIEGQIRSKIIERRDTIARIQKAILDKSFQLSDYVVSQEFTLNSIVGNSIHTLNIYAINRIDSASSSEVAIIESELLAFCTKEKIAEPEVAVDEGFASKASKEPRDSFGSDLFGHQAIVDQKNTNFRDSMVRYVTDNAPQVGIQDDKAEILLRDTPRFNSYFRNSTFSGSPEIEAHAIMILLDRTEKAFDLVFTTDGIIDIHHRKVKLLTPYREVVLKNETIELCSSKYKHKSVDKLALFNLINNLGSNFIRGLEDHVEYIPGILTMHMLLEWFKKQCSSVGEEVACAIVIPTKENMIHYGYPMREDLDTEKNIMQCFYDRITHDVLGMRIARGEGIESTLQSLLLEQDGELIIDCKEEESC